jgi:hypothetical protein
MPVEKGEERGSRAIWVAATTVFGVVLLIGDDCRWLSLRLSGDSGPGGTAIGSPEKADGLLRMKRSSARRHFNNCSRHSTPESQHRHNVGQVVSRLHAQAKSMCLQPGQHEPMISRTLRCKTAATVRSAAVVAPGCTRSGLCAPVPHEDQLWTMAVRCTRGRSDRAPDPPPSGSA